jgi:hypothetical protein
MHAVQVRLHQLLFRTRFLNICNRELDPIFQTLGNAWTKVSAPDRESHFFATLDYEDGKDTFRKVLFCGSVACTLVSSNPPRSSDLILPLHFESILLRRVLADQGTESLMGLLLILVTGKG